MKKILILLLILLFLSGCVSSPVLKVKEALKTEEVETDNDNLCIDNNHNGVCDDKEIPAVVTPVEEVLEEPVVEGLDPLFLEVLDNQDRIKSYYYIKKSYEGGLSSIVIEDKSEIYNKGSLMKQLITNKIYYKNNQGVYHYVYADNASYIVSELLLKDDTILTEFDNVENLVIEKETQTTNSVESMIVRYNIGTDSYRTAIWKYYGVPILIEINNDDDDGTIIRYTELSINHVTDEEVTRPDSEII